MFQMRYKIEIVLLLWLAGVLWQGCGNITNETEPEPAAQPLAFSYISRTTSDNKAKQPESRYACFISTKTGTAELPWRFWNVYLHYPEAVAAAAGANQALVRIRLSSEETGGLEKIANCNIPASRQALAMAKGLLLKNVKSSPVTRKGKPWGSPNSEGFYCPEYYHWGDETQTWCLNSDGVVSLPEVVIEQEEGPPSGEGATDPYTPPPTGDGDTGASGTPCTNCDPNEEKIEVIIDTSFKNNPCLDAVYKQAGEAVAYKNILQNFDGEFSVAHLKLSAGVSQTNPNANAVTKAPNNYIIEIMFNPNKLNRPSLSVARTLMHELIHAEMYRKLLSLANQGDLNYSGWSIQEQRSYVNSIRNNFPGIYDYYRRYVKNWQHEQMAQHYRGQIEQGLRQFDNSKPQSLYNTLAWVGLQNTAAWNNLTIAQKENIAETSENFDNSGPCGN